jgi:hypothetical protein
MTQGRCQPTTINKHVCCKPANPKTITSSQNLTIFFFKGCQIRENARKCNARLNELNSYMFCSIRYSYQLTTTHLLVRVAGGVWWRCIITGHTSILLRGNTGIRWALHKTRRPRPWSWWGGCGPRGNSTAGLWGQVQVWLWRWGIGKAWGHGEEEVVRQSFIRLRNTTGRG